MCGGVSVWVNDTHTNSMYPVISFVHVHGKQSDQGLYRSNLPSLASKFCVLQNTALPLDITTHIHSKDLHPVTYKWSLWSSSVFYLSYQRQKISHKHTSDGALESHAMALKAGSVSWHAGVHPFNPHCSTQHHQLNRERERECALARGLGVTSTSVLVCK